MPSATVTARAAALTKSRRAALGLFAALPAFTVSPSAAKAVSAYATSAESGSRSLGTPPRSTPADP